MVKLSIIIPVYNTEKYLKKCIESIINQTLKDIEIIIINDGSPDNSDKIIKEYNDTRIVYITKENEGIGKTRNKGIDIATGKYIAFVDSDDYLHPCFCEKMLNKAKSDNSEIVVCDFYEDNNGIMKDRIIESFLPTSLSDNPNLLYNINMGPCNKIYKKSLFDNKSNRFNEKLKYEDLPFVVKMLTQAKKISKLDEKLTYYVIHDNSETTKRDKRIFDIIKETELTINYLKSIDFNYDAITNLAVMVLADYTIQMRYFDDSSIRSKFIDDTFRYLDNLNPKWKKCVYLNNFTKIQRFIKTHKLLTKMYCSYYALRRNNEK